MKSKLLTVLLIGLGLVGGTLTGQIIIDGDATDWAGIPRADVGNTAEAIDDVPIALDLAALYITSDDSTVYFKIDIDPATTFAAIWAAATGWTTMELHIDNTLDDTTGVTWGGWMAMGFDFLIELAGVLDPSVLATEADILWDYNGDQDPVWPDSWVSSGTATAAVGESDNWLEVAVPRAAIFAGTNIRPNIETVFDDDWDNPDEIPNDVIDADPAWLIDYNFVTQTVSNVQVRGFQPEDAITIDGDLTDWASLVAVDTGLAAEALGDMATGGEFDILDVYIASDSDNVYIRLDIDPSATLSGGWSNYTYEPLMELWFDTNYGGNSGMAWDGWWALAGDYVIRLTAAYDPAGAATEVPVYLFTGPYSGEPEEYDSVGVATVGVNEADNALEVGISRSLINAGARVRPFIYSVGNDNWNAEEYWPNHMNTDEAEAYYVVEYDFFTGAATTVQVEPADTYPEVSLAIEGRRPRPIPRNYALAQNYPNPFNPVTNITYEIPTAGNVNLVVYNLLGQKVTTLFSGNRSIGRYTAIWSGTTEAGMKVASGIYFYRLEAPGGVNLTRKMLLLQ